MLPSWEFAESLFDVCIPQVRHHFPFSCMLAPTTADPNVTLVSGITSTNPPYLHFTYAELRDVALDSRPASASRLCSLIKN